MSKREELTIFEREYIKTLIDEGYTYSQVQEKFQRKYNRTISKGTITKTLDRYEETKSHEDRPRIGAPQLYSERYKRNILYDALQDRTKTACGISKDDNINPEGASTRTVGRILLDKGLKSVNYSSYDLTIRPKNIDERYEFAKSHYFWTIDQWSQVIFSDESDLLPQKCGKMKVRKRTGEQIFLPPDENLRNLTVKVWGEISYFGVGPLIRYEDTMKADKYIKILEGNVLHYWPNLKSGLKGNDHPLLFQEDNAKAHVNKDTKKFFLKNKISLLSWPPQSADLSPIENVWALLQDGLYNHRHDLFSPEDTYEKAVEIWYNIKLDNIQNLYYSLPDRIHSVYENQGHCI